jgi:uncharacterized membrane protein
MFMKTKGKSRLRGHVFSVLSVTCAVFAFIVCLFSLWCIEAPHKGYLADVFALAFGSIGLVITLVFALTGTVFSIIWIRRNKATKESSYMGWSLVVLVTCSLLFLIALPWLVLRGDLS